MRPQAWLLCQQGRQMILLLAMIASSRGCVSSSLLANSSHPPAPCLADMQGDSLLV